MGILGGAAITTANVILQRLLADMQLMAEEAAAFVAFFVGFCVFLDAIAGVPGRWRPWPRSCSSTASR